ncbi:MAG TPA: DUF1761 domain-containing protein [Cyclobacteriaceae bacterium]|nr:DUF1761 domain-containing protein [Cyclobacteriaceae bacterium]
MPVDINFPAVALCVLLSFLLGFMWYAALFTKPWTKEMGYDPSMRPDKKQMMKGMMLSVVGNFLFVWMLAFYLAGWRYFPNSNDMGLISFAVNSALSVWLGFFVPVHLSKIVWERHSWKLFFINSGYNLVTSIVVAIILAAWT